MTTVSLTVPTRLVERRNSPRPGTRAASTPARGERDFGVGYGRSSGYAAPRGYIDTRATSFFRCR